jgi:hypothetical protein
MIRDAVFAAIIAALCATAIAWQLDPIQWAKDWLGLHSENAPKAGRVRRLLIKLFNCELCLGFWLGCLVHILHSVAHHAPPVQLALAPVVGMCASALATLAAKVGQQP